MKLNKKEVAVVFMALFVLFMSLGAVSRQSHVQAKRMICKSNLEQCYRAMIAFANDNDGNFPDADWNDDGASDSRGQWWTLPFKEYAENDEVLICPVANRKQDENSTESWAIDGRYFPQAIDECWGRRIINASHPDYGQWTWGSYAFNGWLMDPSTGTWGAPSQDAFWGKPETITNPSAVPLFLDSLSVDAWPHHYDTPPHVENELGSGSGYMRLLLQNRHGNGVSMGIFMDGSSRPVMLKELWTLKWHRQFDTDNPFAQPDAALWPTWMQGFQDY